MSETAWQHIEIKRIKAETTMAFLCIVTKINDVDLDEWEVWIPKSQVSDPWDYEKGDENCTMSITEFIATKLEMLD